MLTFDSSWDGYIVQLTPEGDEVYTTPGPVFAPLTTWADFDLQGAWLTAMRDLRAESGNYWVTPDRYEWWETVRRTIAEGMDTGITWCTDCNEPHDRETAVGTRDGDVCESCYHDNYSVCEDCDQSAPCDGFTYTLSDRSVCSDCSYRYSYCEECDGHYHSDDESDHRHGGCGCAPPTYTLTMPNGETTLSADERVTVGLPAGTISDEALRQIAGLVRDHVYALPYGDDDETVTRNKWWSFYYELPSLDSQWQTKEGNYTKRLSKLAYKSQGIKVPAEMVTKVGNIARDNSKGVDFQIELTRQLNLSAEEFYHEDSCWWQSYSEGRCSLKSNGGIGMRSFGKDTWGNEEVTGRVWVMPLKLTDGDLTPTFDGQAADAYMVFNGYGDLSGYTPARILSGMVGMSYRKVGFSCDPMYVNGNMGYLVAPESLTAQYVNTDVNLYADEHSTLYTREWATARLADLVTV